MFPEPPAQAKGASVGVGRARAGLDGAHLSPFFRFDVTADVCGLCRVTSVPHSFICSVFAPQFCPTAGVVAYPPPPRPPRTPDSCSPQWYYNTRFLVFFFFSWALPLLSASSTSVFTSCFAIMFIRTVVTVTPPPQKGPGLFLRLSQKDSLSTPLFLFF